jgi:hypothetical protein
MDFTSTIQNISWFRDRYRDGALILKPPYQRKPVWVAKQKSSLIESILLHLPVPEIYIQKITEADGATTFGIVDGQQRIRTILQFIGSETDPEEQDHNRFALVAVPATSVWFNKSFTDLTDDQKKRFYSYDLAVRYLNTDNDDDVRDVFRRLNKFLLPLRPQELRNATYSGPFITLANKLAEDEYWAENRIVTPEAIRRMSDVEFMSELLIGIKHGPQGGSEAVINSYYALYEDYPDEFPEQRDVQDTFKQTMRVIQQLLPDIKSTRWSNKTDFYTLFVALASLTRANALSGLRYQKLRKALSEFAVQIERAQSASAKSTRIARAYADAALRGANDKRRRADRHEALLTIVRSAL